MDYMTILLAAGAAWFFGAVWQMLMVRPWLAATGLREEDVERSNPLPFLLSFVLLVLVAAMMEHVFQAAGIVTLGAGFWAGLGLGLFVVAPWIISSTMFAKRPINLALIDGMNAMFGCTIIGVVLTVF